MLLAFTAQIGKDEGNLEVTIMQGKTVISSNPVKTSEMIDFNGNIIDPRTKRVIVPKEEEYLSPLVTTTPPVAQNEPVASSTVEVDGLSILDQIEATKRKLVELEELKQLKIAQKKKELELLEQ